ncbi:MAG: hypothetical protein M1269_05960 [Chloroflexi bacterium]|nr:hypothetical protein [Chloroflexota bacterium]
MDIKKPGIDPSASPVQKLVYNIKEKMKPKDVLPLNEDRYTSRSERVVKNVQRQFLNQAVPVIKTGTAAWVGMATGLAVGCAILAGPLVCAVLAGGGAMAAIGLDKFHVPEKVGAAVKAGVGKAVDTVKDAAGHMGRTLKNIINAVKKEKAATISTEGKSEVKAGSISTKVIKGAAPAREGTGKAEKAEKEKPKSTAGKLLGTIGKGFGAVGKGMKAIPRFLYPSIENATGAEKELILKTLDEMPLRTVTSTYKIAVNPDLATKYNASGMARNSLFANMIELDKGSMAVDEFNKGVVIHELGHTKDFNEGLMQVTNPSLKGPWGKGPYVYDQWIDASPNSTYASTNHWEDFAQSHKFYHMHPEELKATNPEKYAAMQKLNEPNLYDKVMDHKPIRDAGKAISEAIDKVPYLRTGLEWLGAVTGPLTLRAGAVKYEKGVIENDEKKKFDGKMDMAKGAVYTMRATAPAGVALSLTHWILGRRIKNGKMTAEKASRIANAVLAVATGPVGTTAYVAMQELSKPEPSKGPYKPHKLKGEKLRTSDKAFIAKVGGGAVIGGAAGTFAGLKGGVIAGAALGGLVGGPVGAGVGAVAGGVLGVLSGSYAGAKVGAEIGRSIHDGK